MLEGTGITRNGEVLYKNSGYQGQFDAAIRYLESLALYFLKEALYLYGHTIIEGMINKDKQYLAPSVKVFEIKERRVICQCQAVPTGAPQAERKTISALLT